MTKRCISCKEELSFGSFHKRTKAVDGLQSVCKECNKFQRKAYYKTANGRDKNTTTGKRWAAKAPLVLFEYLSTHPCVDCGESDPIVLEFDHRDPSKKSFTIGSQARHKGRDSLMKEIEKCDVRCANCHRRRTAVQFNWSKIALMQALVAQLEEQ